MVKQLIAGIALSLAVVTIFFVFTDSKKKEFFTESSEDKVMTIENGFIFISRPSCKYCEVVEPVVKQIAEERAKTVYYLNVQEYKDRMDGEDKEDAEIAAKEYEALKEFFGIKYVPSLIYVKNGEHYLFNKSITETYFMMTEEWQEKTAKELENNILKFLCEG